MLRYCSPLCHKACHQCHQEVTRRRSRTPQKNILVCEEHHQTVRVLSYKHIFHFPGQVLWTTRRYCHGISYKSHCGKPVYGAIWKPSHQYSTTPPLFWRRFVDDTFTILQWSQKISFLEYLNSIDEHIQFTSEEAGDDGSIPFLDVLIIPDEEGNLKTTVYRKPTHMDLYFQWDSNHTVSSKYSVVGSLQNRASTIGSNKELLNSEEHHLEEALTRCKYPTWAINKAKMKTKTAANNNKKGTMLLTTTSRCLT